MRKIMALLLAVLLIIPTLVPIFAMAEAINPTITVESLSEGAGATVEVAVTIKDNPGIMGATLSFTYDSGLTLISATAGEAFSALTMTRLGNYASPSRFVWDGQELNAEDIKDGTILTLRFEIDENAKSGSEYDIHVSYYDGDILDVNMNPVDVTLVNGCVSIFDYAPGDLNGDKNVGTADIIMLRRHIAGGYEQTLNESAGDVNGDGRHNAADVILIRRFIAGGWDVVLVPGNLPKPQCAHIMATFSYQAPTCTMGGNIAYWRCEVCDKFFEDANGAKEVTYAGTRLNPTGHTDVIDVAVAPTYESTGLTEGKHCSVCDEVIVAQTVIPKLELEQYAITYHINNSDTYLQSISHLIENPNPAVYAKQSGLVLEHLFVDGYNFLGWYTLASGGKEVESIQPGETGNRTLYARWEKLVYTIQYEVSMLDPDQESRVSEERFTKYTIDKGMALPTLNLDTYTFLGWSDENGTLWNSIPKGTWGNMTLYANWASTRNRARTVPLTEPMIFEDSKAGLILFTYKIGEIENVPLFTTKELLVINGIITTVRDTNQTEISSTNAKTVAQTISNATTNSSSWTLSKDWNNSTEVSQSYLDQTGQTREEAETLSKSSSSTYNLSSSSGGSSGSTSLAGSSYNLSQNSSHQNSNTNEVGASLSVDAKLSTEVSAEVSGGIPGIGDAKAGAKVGTEISAGAEATAKTSNTGTVGWSSTLDSSGNRSSATTSEKNWNTTSGFSNSNSTSQSTSVSNTVSKVISEQYGIAQTYTEGGSNSNAQGLETSTTNGEEFSSALTYFTSGINTSEVTFQSTGKTYGDYRLVEAGKVHVFAVVGYNVADESYFVYTYNVLDEQTKAYLDYSFDRTFNDYEYSIVPFEVPHNVNEYVNNRIAKTAGLVINPTTGMITGYTPTGDNPDNIIVIPSFWRSANGTAVKVTGIAPGLFKNNTDIKAVQLGNSITEIPDSAFEGCSSLEYVLSPGVTKIGDNAFKGCTSLGKFTIPKEITEVGTNAFEGVSEIVAVASSEKVAQAIASSGADSISLDISNIPADKASGMELNIGTITSFELIGGNKEYRGLSLKSDAETTIVNGVTFSENTKIPLELSSENVNLIRVTVNSTGYALVLDAEQTNVLLNGDVNLNSAGDNALLCKNLNLGWWSSNEEGIMYVNGNVLVCGTITRDNYLIVTDGKIIYITEEEFNNYRNSHRVYFDANGGTVNAESRLVPYNALMGELPTASRDYHVFKGWYTASIDGDLVTSETTMTALTDITLYAYWVPGDISAWTLAANVPSDAEVVGREWRYTQRYETTSSSSSMSGWTQYNSTYVFGNWSGWSTSNPTGNGRNVESRWIGPTYRTGYHYYRWYNGSGMYTYRYNTSYWWEETFFDWILPNASGYTDIKSTNGSRTSSTMWCQADLNYSQNNSDKTFVHYNHFSNNDGRTEYRYQDRVYTYYFYRTENLTSTTPKTNGGLISNVQEWVQYRAK